MPRWLLIRSDRPVLFGRPGSKQRYIFVLYKSLLYFFRWLIEENDVSVLGFSWNSVGKVT